jgi:hypothetical protein
MKRIVMAFVLLTNVAFAQDTVKTTQRINELNLTPYGIWPFSIGMDYKTQIGSKTFFKIGFINLSATNKTDDSYGGNIKRTTVDYSAGLSIGLEFRIPVNDRVSFYHGPNLGYSYDNLKEEMIDPNLYNSRESTQQSHSFSLPYNFGFLFKINNHFLIGIQGNSSVGVSFIDTDNIYPHYPSNNYNRKSINYNLSIVDTDGFVDFVYRF